MKTRKMMTLKEKQDRLTYLIENDLEKAELVIAVKSITDKLQDMAEDLVKVEADDIMPMLDSLRTAFGPQVADQFNNVVTSKLRELVQAVTVAINGIGNETSKLEKSVNGEPANDMSMSSDDDIFGGSDESDDVNPEDSSPDEEDDGDEDMKNLIGDTGGDDEGAEQKTPIKKPMKPMRGNDEDMNHAGRAKKESVRMRGRRLVEYQSVDFQANLNNLSTYDHRAGALAFAIRDMIEDGKFDGSERAGLANVLSHIASCADDHRHWEDPDAKCESALRGARIDTRIPEVRTIISKMKKLCHLISFKHDGMVENKTIARNIKRLREAVNSDALILREFKNAFLVEKHVGRAVAKVARNFAIDESDVANIVIEAKSAKSGTKNTEDEYQAYTLKALRSMIKQKGLTKGQIARMQRSIDVKTKKEEDSKKKLNNVKENTIDAAKKRANRIVTDKLRTRPNASQEEILTNLKSVKSEINSLRSAGKSIPAELETKAKQLAAMYHRHVDANVKSAASTAVSNMAENQIWLDMMNKDTMKLAEREANKPKSPADLRLDKEKIDNYQKAMQFDRRSNKTEIPQDFSTSQQQQQQPPNQQQKQQKPNPTSAKPVMSSGQQMPTNQQQAQTPQDMPKPSTPVGQSPNKNAINDVELPGDTVKSVGNVPIPPMSLMSKPTPYPKPGAPLIGQQQQNRNIAT